MNDYGFSGWLRDMDYVADYLLSGAGFWLLLTFAVIVIAVCMPFSLFLCLKRSFEMSLASAELILDDRRSRADSYYDGSYRLPDRLIRRYVIVFNLGYGIFWNAVIMGRHRVCNYPAQHIYYRADRFYAPGYWTWPMFWRAVNFVSLSFIWGYPLFLLIVSLRMLHSRKRLMHVWWKDLYL